MRTIAGIIVMGLALFTLPSCGDAPSQTSDQTDVDDSLDDSPAKRESHAGHAEQAVDSHPTTNHKSHVSPSESDHPNVDNHHDQHATATGRDANGTAHRGHNGHAHRTHSHRKGHGHSQSDGAAAKIAIGEKVPDFEVTLNGKVWKLSELRKNADITPDGTLVLTFWCSFCHSCRHVERDLDKLAKNNQGKAGVIALDASFGETAAEVAAFAEKRGLTLPIALNASGSVADLFGVNKTTTTVVIDREGKLRYLGQFGDRQHAYAEEALNAVLAGKEVPVERTRPKG